MWLRCFRLYEFRILKFRSLSNWKQGESRGEEELIMYMYSSGLTLLFTFSTAEQAKWTSPSYPKYVMRTERLLLAMSMESQDLVGITLLKRKS